MIDNLFVQMGVRFVSLAENVDSYLTRTAFLILRFPITNVMNDITAISDLKEDPSGL